MSQRIGVMGGMFDPVHQGHLRVARTVLDTLELTALYLVPCATPNHRSAASASAQQRLAMLGLALDAENDPRLQADDREFHRPGISYTVDTMASFADEFPGAALVYIMGWDSFNSLPGWHQWRRMFDYGHVCAVSRPGVDLASGRFAQEHGQEFEERRVGSVDALFDRPQGCIYVLEGVQDPAASSDIRQTLAHGHRELMDVPDAVLNYIRKHDLYTNRV